MSHTYILTDAHNLYYRQVNMTNPLLGIDAQIGMAMHLLLNSMKKEYVKWGGSHCVFFLEGRSWRKDIYPEYKANRVLAYANQTEKEQEETKMLLESFADFIDYLDKKTNVTVIQNPRAEADDMIAVWIETHPDDKHVLISSDSDFFQLLRHPNVTIYDPVKNILIKQDGIYDDDGKRLAFIVDSSARIKVGKPDPNFQCEENWYDYALFLKCIRGDTTDNIFSAYPGVREKGTKNTIGIREAYGDRYGKGYSWTNFMMQRWMDHNQQEQRVLERYTVNRKLIDLSQIPDDIKEECIKIIAEETEKADIPAVEVGMAFMRFCGKWALKRIGDNAESFMPMLKSKYRK